MDNPVALWTADSGEDGTWLSATDAAARLGVSQRTIRRAVARGDLAAEKRNGVYWISPAELARYAAARQPALRPPPSTPSEPLSAPVPPAGPPDMGALMAPATRSRTRRAPIKYLYRWRAG